MSWAYVREFAGLLRALHPLLRDAIEASERAHGGPAGADPFVGLYVDVDDARNVLVQAGECRNTIIPPVLDRPSRLATLAERLDLDEFEARALLLAAAVDFDSGYERVFAYLHDDLTRRRPSIALALLLLCETADASLDRRIAFEPGSRLRRYGLIDLVAPAGPVPAGWPSCALVPGDDVLAFLLGYDALAPTLSSASVRIEAADCAAHDMDVESRRLTRLMQEARSDQQPIGLHLYGGSAASQEGALRAAAAMLARPVIRADVEALLQSPDPRVPARLARQCVMRDAVLLLSGVPETPRPELDAARHALAMTLRDMGVSIVASGAASTPLWPDDGPVAGPPLMPVAFTHPTLEERRAGWRAATQGLIALSAEELDDFSTLTLPRHGVERAVTQATQHARVRAAASSEGQPLATAADLMAAVRAESGTDLRRMAVRIEPRAGWEDLVLPADQSEQLHEICAYARRRHHVFERWGFARVSPRRGLAVLLCGPSGTGKTLAAEVIAGALGLDVFKINIARLVSKYIGDTERNLERVFGAAQAAPCVLFFDEADALFGKRSEVKDAHDRYANIEVGYLLQKMEDFEGIVVLASNLRGNIDEAFARRMQFTVDFPLPGERERRLIWERHLPSEAPLASDVDVPFLSRTFELSGGNIRNIAVAAAMLAAEEHGPIAMAHLRRAVRRELHKAGRAFADFPWPAGVEAAAS
jgi:ATP-dependent 26S proteasome regulatory subunit